MFGIIYNWEIKQGEDTTFTAQLVDDNDQPFDLSNYVFESQLREFPESNEFVQFTVTMVPVQGVFSLFLSAATTSGIMYDRGVYDIFRRNTVTGEKICLLQGEVKIVKQVTR